MSSYDSKDSDILGRELDKQEIIVIANLVSGKNDLDTNVDINNTSLAATIISLDVKEPIRTAFIIKVTNRATGAIVPTASAPVVAGQLMSVTLDATGLTDVCIQFYFAVA